MRRVLFIVVVLLVLPAVLMAGTVAGHVLWARALAPDHFEEYRARLDDEVPALVNEHGVPGVAVALIHRGEIVSVRGFGKADTSTNTRIGADTHFQAGSLSKPVTAWAVMHLAEQGAIDLDSPVSRYLNRWKLPSSDFDPDGVTVRRLLSHTAGLSVGGHLGYEPGVGLPSVEEQLTRGPDAADGNRGVRVAYRPGGGVHYSGGGYTVLQLLVEEVSGQSFGEYARANVLEPLGMGHSTFDPTDPMIRTAATPYDPDGAALPHYRFASKAAGGLYTTPADLARFVAAIAPTSDGAPMAGRILAAGTVDQVLSPAPGATTRVGPVTMYSQGLGYHLDPVLLGVDTHVVGHDGSNRGWKSTFLALAEHGEWVVILTSSEVGGALNDRVRCGWVTWATGGTTPTCLTMQLKFDAAVAGAIWLTVLAIVTAREVLRARRRSSRLEAPQPTIPAAGA